MPIFTLQSKEVKLIFGQISAKYESYSLTFLQKWANFCHFLLYNQKKWNWFLVKFRQNTKTLALCYFLAKIGLFIPLFTLQSKEVKLIFGKISAKYQAYSLTFWRKLANFCHFSLYNERKSKGFLVKFRQNTKLIALLFDENLAIFLPVFTLQSKEVKLSFGQISAKYQAFSLTFWQKWANFCHFLLYNQKKSNWFLVKFRQNTKTLALLFGENWPIYTTFHSTIKGSQIDFW